MTKPALTLAGFLALAGGSAHAATIFNGSFENVGTATSSFSISNPTVLPGWTATPSGNHVLDCLVFAGATNQLCGTPNGWTLQFWNGGVGGGFPGGSSPDGGNFVAIDGDQNFATPLTQTINGLIIGQQYTITFYQAAAQQFGFDGATTEQWQVSLGAETQLSTLMINANHGYVDWMPQTMTFTAQSTSSVLSFLAIGTPNGLPPFVLLDGVTISDVPEPGTLTLCGIAAVLMGIGTRRRRPAAGPKSERVSDC